MSNLDKRQKRAKQKAKIGRVKKQQELEGKVLVVGTRITPHLEYFFKSLPYYDLDDFEAVPRLKQYVIETEGKNNLEVDVALLYALYLSWQFNDASVQASDVASMAADIVSTPRYQERLIE